MQYSFKIERHEGRGFYVGLGATSDDSPGAPMTSYEGWKMYPWNDGVEPTSDQLERDYTDVKAVLENRLAEPTRGPTKVESRRAFLER